jgi:hypothetical protein
LDENKAEPFTPFTPPPALYVFNTASMVKPHAIEKLAAKLTGYGIDIALITETHLKKLHADSCFSRRQRSVPTRQGSSQVW